MKDLFMSWCMESDILITALYLPGILNSVADTGFRSQGDRSDWKLNPSVFQKIKIIRSPDTNQPPTGHMAYLRGKFTSQELSEEATVLMHKSWRSKTSKSYDALFAKWSSR